MDDEKLSSLIDSQLRGIQATLEMKGQSVPVAMEERNGFYTLTVNGGVMISVEGKKAFFYGLAGFIRGMNYAWHDFQC